MPDLMPSILPPNATNSERALEQTLARPIGVAVVSDLLSPERCPASLLGFLAWAYSVDVWDPSWTEAEKRAVIAQSIEVHRTKGSIGSIRRALTAAGYTDAEIIEGSHVIVGAPWTVGDDTRVGGPMHWAHYWVIVRSEVTPGEVQTLAAMLSETAPAHCELTHLSVANVNQAVGGDWTVAEPIVAVGSTYIVEQTYG